MAPEVPYPLSQWRAVEDVLGVNYLMRRPVLMDEAERVIHALGLANYELVKRPPEKGHKP